jgi:hypothetical protein
MQIEVNPRVLLAVCGALVLIPLTVSAVPSLTTFSAGQPIRAADINSNFTTLRTAIQGLESGSRCKVLVQGCSAAVCQVTCPSGFHVEGGGCDATLPGRIAESMPAGPTSFSNGEHPIDFFNKWNCQADSGTGGGTIQGAYAFCCQD